MSIFKNPYVRLAGRAVVAGLAAGVVAYGNHQSDQRLAWQAAIVAAVLAATEILTPLNQIVGLFKQ